MICILALLPFEFSTIAGLDQLLCIFEAVKLISIVENTKKNSPQGERILQVIFTLH
jgi:hypothetical protein